MKILQITAHYNPNIGGVETHLEDLVSALAKRKHKVFVLTYQPLQTKTEWKIFERKNNIKILRIPWIPGLFYKLIDKPILEFLYLLPGIFLITPIVILFDRPEVLHAHGIVAGFVGAFWGKLFGIHTVVSTHSIYHFPKNGVYRQFAKLIFGTNDQVLCLSDQSVQEIQLLGVKNVSKFTYWVDLKKFKPMSESVAKKELNWKSKFCVLFVSRLVKEKGILILDEAARILKKHSISVYVAGNGPEFENIKNCILLGSISQEELPIYYNAADLLIVPSIHEEGFGRVILESLACGTPVVAANRGAIPEAMNNTVGKLIDITPANIKNSVKYFYKNPQSLKQLSKNARNFASKRYSQKNAEKIIRHYR